MRFANDANLRPLTKKKYYNDSLNIPQKNMHILHLTDSSSIISSL